MDQQQQQEMVKGTGKGGKVMDESEINGKEEVVKGNENSRVNT